MKDTSWDGRLLAGYRAYIRSENARQAFDSLVSGAIQLPSYDCRPSDAKGPKKTFVYDDAVSGDRPFAFIVNREHLLFYVRKEGIRLVAGGLSALQEVVPRAAENNAGEWTIRIETTDDANRLQAFLFARAPDSDADVGAGGTQLRLWRASPDSARDVFASVFEGVSAKARRLWEAFLAASIEYAISKFPDRSVVVLEPTYVSTTVGMVRCLKLEHQTDLIVLLERSTAPAGTRWSNGRYKHAPGCEEAYISRVARADSLASIRESHFRAINACGEAHAGNSQRRRAHSPGVLRYLEKVLGGKLSDPSYIAEPATEPHIPASDLVDDAVEQTIHQRTDIGPTEKARLVNARRGQGLYRANLTQIEKRCRVTGVSDGRYLLASHIKPWSKSDDREKLDGYNGLLLSPNVDHLFDGGYISFQDNGDLLVSQDLRDDILTALGLRRGINVGAFRPEQCKYLKWHRTNYGFTKIPQTEP